MQVNEAVRARQMCACLHVQSYVFGAQTATKNNTVRFRSWEAASPCALRVDALTGRFWQASTTATTANCWRSHALQATEALCLPSRRKILVTAQYSLPQPTGASNSGWRRGPLGVKLVGFPEETRYSE